MLDQKWMGKQKAIRVFKFLLLWCKNANKLMTTYNLEFRVPRGAASKVIDH